MNNYYVYIYYDPRKTPAEPIYVGKGHGDRYKHHLFKSHNQFLFRKIEKIREAGMEPIVEFAKKDISNNESIQLEIELIEKYGRFDKGLGTLCNFTDGGEGTVGRICSDSTKKLFSEQRKGKKQTEAQYNANCSRKINDETRLKISKATKGHQWHTEEQIQAIINYNKNREITDEMRSKWSKTRLGNTPTKANYPPTNELINIVNTIGINQTSKNLGIGNNSLFKYLKRRGITKSSSHPPMWSASVDPNKM